MSIKTKLFAGAAALTMVSGAVIAATAGTAMAGTPSCGHDCINIWQARYGTVGAFNPEFVTDTYKQRQQVGTPIIEFRASNADPAEDYTISQQGRVSEFYAAGLVSATLALHYGCELGPFPTCPPVVDTKSGNQLFYVTSAPGVTPVTYAPVTPDLEAYEVEYAPFGADSGLCIGVAATAVSGEGVTLQPCGVSSKTIWVIDYMPVTDACQFVTINKVTTCVIPRRPQDIAPDPTGIYGVALINGSDNNFSQPFVMTYTGEPTAMPRAQVFVSNLSGFSQNDGSFPQADSSLQSIDDNQQWFLAQGVLP